MNATGYCHSERYNTRVDIMKVECYRFSPVQGGALAQKLLGTKGLPASSVLMYATEGTADTYARCSGDVKFKEANSAAPGFLIVGKNGKHCAVLDKEGNKFVQVDPASKVVVLTPVTYIDKYFPGGYTLRDYSC